MSDRSVMSPNEPERVRRDLEALIREFRGELPGIDLRRKVLALVPAFHRLRELGKALLPEEAGWGARDRILAYFRRYPRTVIHGDELLVVSGIQEYARRVRELRVEFGWFIASGYSIGDMIEDGEHVPEEYRDMRPEEYVLLEEEPDREAAHRWNTANEIRKSPGSVKSKILRFMQANVGHAVTGDELRYVAGNRTEWARRTRELRTEEGWPVATRSTGRPDLPVGYYVLEEDRQSPAHDRKIPDPVRRTVLMRDSYRCTDCGWTHESWNRSDPRHLELHHVQHHARGGGNDEDNLTTLCTVCHDERHRREK